MVSRLTTDNPLKLHLLTSPLHMSNYYCSNDRGRAALFPVRFVVVYFDRAEVTREISLSDIEGGENKETLKKNLKAIDKWGKIDNIGFTAYYLWVRAKHFGCHSVICIVCYPGMPLWGSVKTRSCILQFLHCWKSLFLLYSCIRRQASHRKLTW